MASARVDRLYGQPRTCDPDAFIDMPYSIEAQGAETLDYRGARLPTNVQVHMSERDEVLQLRTDRDVLGYYPHDTTSRVRMVAVLLNGAFRLVDRHGNEFAFDPAGRLGAFLTSRPVVTGLQQGDHRINFRFGLSTADNLAIVEATTTVDRDHVLRYRYDGPTKLLIQLVEQVSQ